VQERAGNTLKLIGIVNDFLNRPQEAQQQTVMIDTINDCVVELHKIKKLQHNKRNGHQIEGAAHRVGENLCQLYI
jgi:hypothetical protein